MNDLVFIKKRKELTKVLMDILEIKHRELFALYPQRDIILKHVEIYAR